MSETVERNNRFYKQPDGEVFTENEQLKEWLVIANKHNDELQKERDMYKGSFETMSENYFKLETIMKEVREYIKEHIKYECDDAFNGKQFYSYHLYDFDKKELLEILDNEVN